MLSWLQPVSALCVVTGCMQFGGCKDRKVEEWHRVLWNSNSHACVGLNDLVFLKRHLMLSWTRGKTSCRACFLCLKTKIKGYSTIKPLERLKRKISCCVFFVFLCKYLAFWYCNTAWEPKHWMAGKLLSSAEHELLLVVRRKCNVESVLAWLKTINKIKN